MAFFANCIFIFHKTEVQTVILRSLTGLNLNWLKSYGTKCKHFHFPFFAIIGVFALCVITFEPIKIQTCSAPQNDSLNLSFARYLVKWRKLGQKWSKIGFLLFRIFSASLQKDVTFDSGLFLCGDCLTTKMVVEHSKFNS